MADHNPPKTIGKYTIQDTLGRGAMGVVYKGFDPLIQRTVAIKVIRKAAFADDELAEALDRFRREAQAAGRLIHPNIVTVYEYGEEDDTAFIAMEYIEGHSLKEVLDGKPALTLAEVARILSQLLSGLQYAHASGIVHRDIKPDNLIFAGNGTLKIMDFGVARLESSSLTMAGSVMGTPSYMAPELFSGAEIDQRSDLFSAGIILYQLLTGHKPFSGSSMTTIMHQVVNVMPAKPSHFDKRLPAPLDDLIQTCLAKNPANRYQNAADFLAALHAAFAKVNEALVIPGQASPSSSNQEATLYEPGAGPAPLLLPLAKIKQLPRAVFIGVGLVALFLILFFIFTKSGQAPVADLEDTSLSSRHKKNVAPKTLRPIASKKRVTEHSPQKRTGITITTPGSDPRQTNNDERPASRNAITITVPDRP